jgi:hypothetical protein
MDDGLSTYNTEGGDLYYDLARSIVSGVDVKGSLDAIWAEVRAKEKELLHAASTGEPVTEREVKKVIEVATKMPERVVNTLYDDLWKRVAEAKAKKGAREKRVDERQLFLFQ